MNTQTIINDTQENRKKMRKLGHNYKIIPEGIVMKTQTKQEGRIIT